MAQTKTHWKKVFDSDYLGSCDIEDGKELKLVIDHVEIRKVKNTNGADEERNVAVFKGDTKPMILNATNCKQIKKFSKSPFIQDWSGVAIQVYVKADIKAFGDVTEGLRIRDFQPKIGKDTLTPEHKAWDGAVKFIKDGGKIEDIKKKYDLSVENELNLLTFKPE